MKYRTIPFYENNKVWLTLPITILIIHAGVLLFVAPICVEGVEVDIDQSNGFDFFNVFTSTEDGEADIFGGTSVHGNDLINVTYLTESGLGDVMVEFQANTEDIINVTVILFRFGFELVSREVSMPAECCYFVSAAMQCLASLYRDS